MKSNTETEKVNSNFCKKTFANQQEILQTADVNPLLFILRERINNCFKQDQELSVINVQIINTKRNSNNDAIAFLKFYV